MICWMRSNNVKCWMRFGRSNPFWWSLPFRAQRGQAYPTSNPMSREPKSNSELANIFVLFVEFVHCRLKLEDTTFCKTRLHLRLGSGCHGWKIFHTLPSQCISVKPTWRMRKVISLWSQPDLSPQHTTLSRAPHFEVLSWPPTWTSSRKRTRCIQVFGYLDTGTCPTYSWRCLKAVEAWEFGWRSVSLWSVSRAWRCRSLCSGWHEKKCWYHHQRDGGWWLQSMGRSSCNAEVSHREDSSAV